MRRIAGLMLLLMMLPLARAHASCTNPQGTCTVGPGLQCTQLLYDTQLSQWDAASCPYWVGSGWTSYHVNNASGDDYWEIQPWGGSVFQQFTVPSAADSMDMYAVIYLIKNTVGTERIRVAITNSSGTVVETLGTYYGRATPPHSRPDCVSATHCAFA